MNTQDILEKLECVTQQLEKTDKEVNKVQLKRDRKIREYSKTLKELYKKNVELVEKLKKYE